MTSVSPSSVRSGVCHISLLTELKSKRAPQTINISLLTELPSVLAESQSITLRSSKGQPALGGAYAYSILGIEFGRDSDRYIGHCHCVRSRAAKTIAGKAGEIYARESTRDKGDGR